MRPAFNPLKYFLQKRGNLSNLHSIHNRFLRGCTNYIYAFLSVGVNAFVSKANNLFVLSRFIWMCALCSFIMFCYSQVSMLIYTVCWRSMVAVIIPLFKYTLLILFRSHPWRWCPECHWNLHDTQERDQYGDWHGEMERISGNDNIGLNKENV